MESSSTESENKAAYTPRNYKMNARMKLMILCVDIPLQVNDNKSNSSIETNGALNDSTYVDVGKTRQNIVNQNKSITRRRACNAWTTNNSTPSTSKSKGLKFIGKDIRSKPKSRQFAQRGKGEYEYPDGYNISNRMSSCRVLHDSPSRKHHKPFQLDLPSRSINNRKRIHENALITQGDHSTTSSSQITSVLHDKSSKIKPTRINKVVPKTSESSKKTAACVVWGRRVPKTAVNTNRKRKEIPVELITSMKRQPGQYKQRSMLYNPKRNFTDIHSSDSSASVTFRSDSDYGNAGKMRCTIDSRHIHGNISDKKDKSNPKISTKSLTIFDTNKHAPEMSTGKKRIRDFKVTESTSSSSEHETFPSPSRRQKAKLDEKVKIKDFNSRLLRPQSHAHPSTSVATSTKSGQHKGLWMNNKCVVPSAKRFPVQIPAKPTPQQLVSGHALPNPRQMREPSFRAPISKGVKNQNSSSVTKKNPKLPRQDIIALQSRTTVQLQRLNSYQTQTPKLLLVEPKTFPLKRSVSSKQEQVEATITPTPVRPTQQKQGIFMSRKSGKIIQKKTNMFASQKSRKDPQRNPTMLALQNSKTKLFIPESQKLNSIKSEKQRVQFQGELDRSMQEKSRMLASQKVCTPKTDEIYTTQKPKNIPPKKYESHIIRKTETNTWKPRVPAPKIFGMPALVKTGISTSKKPVKNLPEKIGIYFPQKPKQDSTQKREISALRKLEKTTSVEYKTVLQKPTPDKFRKHVSQIPIKHTSYKSAIPPPYMHVLEISTAARSRIPPSQKSRKPPQEMPGSQKLQDHMLKKSGLQAPMTTDKSRSVKNGIAPEQHRKPLSQTRVNPYQEKPGMLTLQSHVKKVTINPEISVSPKTKETRPGNLGMYESRKCIKQTVKAVELHGSQQVEKSKQLKPTTAPMPVSQERNKFKQKEVSVPTTHKSGKQTVVKYKKAAPEEPEKIPPESSELARSNALRSHNFNFKESTVQNHEEESAECFESAVSNALRPESGDILPQQSDISLSHTSMDLVLDKPGKTATHKLDELGEPVLEFLKSEESLLQKLGKAALKAYEQIPQENSEMSLSQKSDNSAAQISDKFEGMDMSGSHKAKKSKVGMIRTTASEEFEEIPPQQSDTSSLSHISMDLVVTKHGKTATLEADKIEKPKLVMTAWSGQNPQENSKTSLSDLSVELGPLKTGKIATEESVELKEPSILGLKDFMLKSPEKKDFGESGRTLPEKHESQKTGNVTPMRSAKPDPSPCNYWKPPKYTQAVGTKPASHQT